MRSFGSTFLSIVAASVAFACCASPSHAQSTAPLPPAAAFPQRDGSHDFDFLIGSWKARVRVLKNRLNNSTDPKDWYILEGTSVHRKLLDSNANFEEFNTVGVDSHGRNKGQTLRLYNPTTHMWSIYLVDVDEGTLNLPPVTGYFTGKRGEFYNQDVFKGRMMLTRYVWTDVSPHEARMEQSFSADGGKTWEVNWICELSR